MERVSVFMNPLVSETIIDVPVKFAELLDPSKLQLKIENFILTQTSDQDDFSIILKIEEIGKFNQSNQDGDYSSELSYIQYPHPPTVYNFFTSIPSDYTRTNALGFSCPDMALTNNRRLKFSIDSHGGLRLVNNWTWDNGTVHPEVYGGVSFDAVFYLMKD